MTALTLCSSALLLLIAVAFLLRKRLRGLHAADFRAFGCDLLAFPAVALYLLMLVSVGVGCRCVFWLWHPHAGHGSKGNPTPHGGLTPRIAPSRA